MKFKIVLSLVKMKRLDTSQSLVLTDIINQQIPCGVLLVRIGVLLCAKGGVPLDRREGVLRASCVGLSKMGPLRESRTGDLLSAKVSGIPTVVTGDIVQE